MCWEQWVAKFEELEQKHYGYKLDGEGRHSTLYDLFKDGYAPERAFKFVLASAQLEKIGPLALPAVVICAIRIVFMVRGKAVPSLPLWVRHRIKSVVRLAANSKPTHLHAVK